MGDNITPNEEGIYRICNANSSLPDEIEVYDHPIKGLCCWVGDYGAEQGEYPGADGHVPVNMTGIYFIEKIN